MNVTHQKPNLKASWIVAKNIKFRANLRSFTIKSEQTRINTSVDAIWHYAILWLWSLEAVFGKIWWDQDERQTKKKEKKD